jgi:hypothetical protein
LPAARKRNYASEYASRRARNYWANYQREQLKTLEGLAQYLFDIVRRRSRKRGIEVTIDRAWIVQRLREQNLRCRATGIDFDLEITPRAYQPWQPSLDRINPLFGYTPENVQIVVLMYNWCKNIGTDADVREFARAISQNDH